MYTLKCDDTGKKKVWIAFAAWASKHFDDKRGVEVCNFTSGQFLL